MSEKIDDFFKFYQQIFSQSTQSMVGRSSKVCLKPFTMFQTTCVSFRLQTYSSLKQEKEQRLFYGYHFRIGLITSSPDDFKYWFESQEKKLEFRKSLKIHGKMTKNNTATLMCLSQLQGVRRGQRKIRVSSKVSMLTLLQHRIYSMANVEVNTRTFGHTEFTCTRSIKKNSRRSTHSLNRDPFIRALPHKPNPSTKPDHLIQPERTSNNLHLDQARDAKGNTLGQHSPLPEGQSQPVQSSSYSTQGKKKCEK